MSQVHAAFRTAGALVAQRAMIDYDALDSLVDPYRVHPDTDGRDETVILRRLESLVARLRTSEGSPSTAAQVSKRGADIAMSGTVEDGGDVTLGAGLVAVAKIVDDCQGHPAFSGRAGECIRTITQRLPRSVR